MRFQHFFRSGNKKKAHSAGRQRCHKQKMAREKRRLLYPHRPTSEQREASKIAFQNFLDRQKEERRKLAFEKLSACARYDYPSLRTFLLFCHGESNSMWRFPRRNLPRNFPFMCEEEGESYFAYPTMGPFHVDRRRTHAKKGPKIRTHIFFEENKTNYGEATKPEKDEEEGVGGEKKEKGAGEKDE